MTDRPKDIVAAALVRGLALHARLVELMGQPDHKRHKIGFVDLCDEAGLQPESLRFESVELVGDEGTSFELAIVPRVHHGNRLAIIANATKNPVLITRGLRL